MPSLYAEYIKEREGKDIIENDKGYATYIFTDSNTCYIADIYVRQQYRKENVASQMANEIVELAKEKGCNRLLGSVCPQANGADISEKVLIAYGMEKYKSEINIEGKVVLDYYIKGI